MNEEDHFQKMIAKQEARLTAKISAILDEISVTTLKDRIENNLPVELIWKYTISLWPRRCYISDKIIFPGTKAYRGTSVVKIKKAEKGKMVFHNQWEMANRVIWMSKEEFVLRKLKGYL